MTSVSRAHAGILPTEMILDRREDGTMYARSPVTLGPYPVKLTERLEMWATRVPDRPFLARRIRGSSLIAGAPRDADERGFPRMISSRDADERGFPRMTASPRDADERGFPRMISAAPDSALVPWEVLTYADTLVRVRSLAQALLDRRLSVDRPLVILSGNSLEHALLGLAAMYCGVPYAPISPSYSLLARDHATLRSLWRSLRPGLVFADDGPAFERALESVADDRTLVVTRTAPESVDAAPFGELLRTTETPAVDRAHGLVNGDTIAKILYTSGSTGHPKGVINTQRMLCANQEMLCTVLPLLAQEPPVLCDWLPWNHTFGGNHNFGIALYNGGTLYLDDGRPTPGEFETTIANLREIATTAYFNVPRGYDLLVPRLRDDTGLRRHFFSRMRMLFCAAAALRQQTADDLQAMAIDAHGAPIPLVTGLGATESAPFALCAGAATFAGGRIGVPVPGVELKLARVGEKLEGRLRGPNITPGYWGEDALTQAAFDEEGFYRLGDALRFFDPADPSKGFAFEGRLAEDFKLSSGTWVRVGPLRARFLAHCGDLVQDVVITAPDRDFVGALIFPNLSACRSLIHDPSPSTREVLDHPVVRERFGALLAELAAESPGNSTCVCRAILLEEPPSIDRHELTEKASVNQKAVLKNRAALVEQLYGAEGSGILMAMSGGSR